MRMLVAADSSWKLEDGSLFNACTDAIKVTNHGNPLPDPKSGWIDFAIYTLPGANGTGRIELFANDKPIITVTGTSATTTRAREEPILQVRPYRAADGTDWTLFYDDFRRSPNCSDVLKAGRALRSNQLNARAMLRLQSALLDSPLKLR